MSSDINLHKGILKREKLSDQKISAVKVDFKNSENVDEETLKNSVKIIGRLKNLQKKERS